MEKYYGGDKLMKITSCEITNTKYVQIYLIEEELEKKETKEVIQKYKKEKSDFNNKIGVVTLAGVSAN